MSSTTILGETISTEVPGTTNTQANYVEELVGEGKKYSSVEDLAKAYVHADKFIETLKQEKQEVVSKYSELELKAKTVEDVLEALNFTPTTTITTPQTTQPQITPPVVSQEEVSKLVAQELENRKELEKIKSNQATAWEELGKLFGSVDLAKKNVAEFVKDNPVRQETINKLGSYDPEALITMFKPMATQNTQVEFIQEGSVVIPPLTNGIGLTWKRANEIKKSDPKTYNSLKFQTELHKAADTNPNFWK